jgi:hypothetical protein
MQLELVNDGPDDVGDHRRRNEQLADP